MASPPERTETQRLKTARAQAERLNPVQQTLLIPLVARALGGAFFPDHACDDAQARELLDKLGEDGHPWLSDRPTILNVLWRTGLIREIATEFFAQHPKAWGLNLGCGLSHYFQWLDNGQNTWLDADLPEVMDLRATLMPGRPRRLRRAVVDLQAADWWQQLRLPRRALAQPVFVLCEGVLMYFQPDEAHHVLQQFSEQAPSGSLLLTDTMACNAVGQARWHASVGRTEAQFHWGLQRMQELTDSHPRLMLRSTHSVAASHGWMGLAMEAWWRPWISAPLYGLAVLEVR